uniref:Uncharacterized protein n=1 Tax=Arundo donax TaxID=35708 RepID=A0A0A9AT61_ARUDO
MTSKVLAKIMFNPLPPSMSTFKS